MIYTNSRIPLSEAKVQKLNDFSANSVKSSKVSTKETKSFADILTDKQIEKAGSLKFSKHASIRLSQRNIELSDAQRARLENGAMAAMKKGINESLVMVDQLAFIVNVKNNTVVTALDQNEASGNVFTNIDGAVIA